jgi:hypothetical protein
LDPTIGRILANVTGQERPVPTSQLFETTMANLPFTRLLTSARQLTDPRKGPGAKAANLLTGFRVTDVPERTRDALIREEAEQLMKTLGARTFEKVYFAKDELAAMPADQRRKAEQLNYLMTTLAQRAKQRREERNR